MVVNDRHKLVSKNGCLEPRKLELGLEIVLISLDDDTRSKEDFRKRSEISNGIGDVMYF